MFDSFIIIGFPFSDALDNLDDKVSAFFKKCTQANAKNDWREEQFTKLKQVSWRKFISM